MVASFTGYERVAFNRVENRPVQTEPTEEQVPARKSATKLPAEVQAAVEHLNSALSAIIRGDDIEGQTERADIALNAALEAARASAPKKGASFGDTLPSTFGYVVGQNVKDLRLKAGWTQEMLAEAMTEAGYDWKRITCAEVEGDKRRLAMEELLVLASLFAVPAVELMVPNENALLDLETQSLSAREVRELLVGQCGSIGEGGTAWRLAMRVVRGIKRPANDLWKKADQPVVPLGRGRSKVSQAD
jgi:hypothetical protein